MTWRNISEYLSLQQDCSEDFKSPKRTTVLNKYETNDVFRKYVDLKKPSEKDFFLSRPEV
jgi:hypothetical protein